MSDYDVRKDCRFCGYRCTHYGYFFEINDSYTHYRCAIMDQSHNLHEEVTRHRLIFQRAWIDYPRTEFLLPDFVMYVYNKLSVTGVGIGLPYLYVWILSVFSARPYTITVGDRIIKRNPRFHPTSIQGDAMIGLERLKCLFTVCEELPTEWSFYGYYHLKEQCNRCKEKIPDLWESCECRSE